MCRKLKLIVNERFDYLGLTKMSYSCKLRTNFLAILFVILFLTSCNNDSNDEECTGNLFFEVNELVLVGESIPTALITLGNRFFGVICESCTNDKLSEEFELSFEPSGFFPDQTDILTVFAFEGNQYAMIAVEPNSIELFEIVQGEDGPFGPTFVRGELLGILENIEVIKPDNLELLINLENEKPEQVFCDFCWVAQVRPCKNS